MLDSISQYFCHFFQDQKKAWAESVYFCEEQYFEFKRLMLSQRAAM